MGGRGGQYGQGEGQRRAAECGQPQAVEPVQTVAGQQCAGRSAAGQIAEKGEQPGVGGRYHSGGRQQSEPGQAQHRQHKGRGAGHAEKERAHQQVGQVFPKTAQRFGQVGQRGQLFHLVVGLGCWAGVHTSILSAR